MPAVFAGTIFTTTMLPAPTAECAIRVSDKLLHMALYGGMAVIIAMAVQRPGHALSWRAALAAAALSTFYGILEEYHQSFVPARTVSGDDMLANATGACLAAAWYLVAAHKWPRISLILGG